MYPNLISAKPIDKLTLLLNFDNGEIKTIDMGKYCSTEYFNQLKDNNYFQKVTVNNGVVTWPNEQDIAPETLYLDSIKQINH